MTFITDEHNQNIFRLMDNTTVLAIVYRPGWHTDRPRWRIDIEYSTYYYPDDTPEGTILKTVIRDVWAIHQSRVNRLGKMYEQEGYTIESPC